MMDARVRHDPAIEVMVSGRIVGRAEGGMADAIRRRMVQQDEFTDDQVEPAEDAFRRYSLRERARRAWTGAARPGSGQRIWGCQPHGWRAAWRDGFFGSAWAALEARSPVLQRRRVRFADLPRRSPRPRRFAERLKPPAVNLAAD